MYAVIRTGGKQYRVAQGDVVKVEKLEGDAGTELTFEDVLLVGDDEQTRIGTPVIEGAQVKGTIVEQGRDKKLLIFKFRRRKGYKLKKGHRQSITRVRIDEIAVA